jgi:beta-galactosidase
MSTIPGPVRRAALLCLTLLLAACPRSDPTGLPEGFLLGTALSGFQAEMGCPTIPADECEDRNSDWYAFVTDERTRASGQAFLSGEGTDTFPGHYELYETDLDLAAGLGTNAFRFSLEWSRLFPEATDDVAGYQAMRAAADPVAVAHYHAVIDAALARGLTPLVTLNHYSLPLWIHDGAECHLDFANCSPRGWVDKDRTVAEIAKFAGFAAREYGDKVAYWATLNEPFAVLLPGYLMPSQERTNPPAVLMQIQAAKTVLEGLVEGHARMYDAIKAERPEASVGVVYAMAPVAPKDPDNVLDVYAAQNVFYLFNMVYLNAVVLGLFDADLEGPEHAVSRPDLAGRMDYLGVNYYTRATVVGTEDPVFPDLSPLTTFDPFQLQVWEDYPEGLYDMLRIATQDLGVPVIVTENGVEDPEDDGTGPSFFVRHLAEVERAIADGMDVRGYFYWTLTDNFEWNHGTAWRMGVFGVEPDDPAKARYRRQVADAIEAVAAHSGIPPALRDLYMTDAAGE